MEVKEISGYERNFMNTIMADEKPILEMHPINFSDSTSLMMSKNKYKFFQIKEIPESDSYGFRTAISNVISGTQSSDKSLVYILSSTHTGIELYMGISGEAGAKEIDDGIVSLKNNFEGNLLGSKTHYANVHDLENLVLGENIGLITGVPSFNDDEKNTQNIDYQTIERLVNPNLGKLWQIVIVSEAMDKESIKEEINMLYELSTNLSHHLKHSIQETKNEGWSKTTTIGKSRTITNGISRTRTDGTSSTNTQGMSDTKTKGVNSSDTTGENKNFTEGKSYNQTKGTNSNISQGTNSNYTHGSNSSVTRGKSDNISSSQSSEYKSKSTDHGTNFSKSDGTNTSKSYGTNSSRSHGTNTSESSGTNQSKSIGFNESKTIGTNHSRSQGVNKSISEGKNESLSVGANYSLSDAINDSDSQGDTGGISLSYSKEKMDKKAEALHTYISDTLLNRYYLGQTKGLFKTAIYVCADSELVFDKLANGMVSLFQGNKISMVPMQIHKLPKKKNVSFTQLLNHMALNQDVNNREIENFLIQSVPFSQKLNKYLAATILTTAELSLVTALPNNELPGIKIRKSVDFSINMLPVQVNDRLNLGSIIQHGRDLTKDLEQYKAYLNKKELNKHIFICGVTGSGKTTTCMKLLLESGMPFLVIEPAKTEYRALTKSESDIEFYSIGREDLSVFRLNPFELVRGEHLASHISMLKATLIAVYPMEAAMPYMVEEAIIRAYESKGWDKNSSINYLYSDPWDSSENVWPTFSDMINELTYVVESKGLGTDFKEKYLGSLVARFTNMTLGINGRILNAKSSIDFDKLLDKKIVIELEEIKDEQDKALLMGFIIIRLAECMKQRHKSMPNFKHLTLIEEAHRLLSKIEPGDDGSKKNGIEMFANLLAEVRKYGEGLIIADQIPNKLIADVIKNTNTKIVHRLFAADDRQTIGDAISLNDDQRDFLTSLDVGEAIVYMGGSHAPIRVKISPSHSTTAGEIDEGKIKQIGVRQFWENRNKLLPQLAAVFHGDAEAFHKMYFDGIETINRLQKIIAFKLEFSIPDKCFSNEIYQLQLKNLVNRINASKAALLVDETTFINYVGILLVELKQLEISDKYELREVVEQFLYKILVSDEEFNQYFSESDVKLLFKKERSKKLLNLI